MASHPRELAGHAPARRPGGSRPGTASTLPRLSFARPRALYLGTEPRRGPAARGDSGVPAGSAGPNAHPKCEAVRAAARPAGVGGSKAMATIRIPEQNRTLTEPAAVRKYLAGIGIDHEHWEPSHPVGAKAPAEEVLAAYSSEIERLKSQGGYVTADVIDVHAQTPGLERSEEH